MAACSTSARCAVSQRSSGQNCQHHVAFADHHIGAMQKGAVAGFLDGVIAVQFFGAVALARTVQKAPKNRDFPGLFHPGRRFFHSRLAGLAGGPELGSPAPARARDDLIGALGQRRYPTRSGPSDAAPLTKGGENMVPRRSVASRVWEKLRDGRGRRCGAWEDESSANEISQPCSNKRRRSGTRDATTL